MALDKRQRNKLIFSIVALAASGVVFFGMFGPEGCGPSEEDQRILSVLNSLDEITAKGGHVNAISTAQREGDDDKDVYRYEAEVLNQEGVSIGKLRGGRVEGFGTMKPHILWYKTPGVPEEWPQRQGGRHRRNRQQQP